MSFAMNFLSHAEERLRHHPMVQSFQRSHDALLAENQRLRQEVQELKNVQRPQVPGESGPQMPSAELTAFPVQVLVRGQTGGCEKLFLDNVTKLLAGQGISLHAEDYKENSEHFLLLFCPVATNVAADTGNALKDLGGVPKGLLVVFHHKPKGSRNYFLDSQVPHPAVGNCAHLLLHARWLLPLPG